MKFAPPCTNKRAHNKKPRPNSAGALEFISRQQSVKTPVAILGAASRTIARQFPAATIGGCHEIAANNVAAAILAYWLEIAAFLSMIPVIAAADIAIETAGIDLEGIRLIVAIDISRDRVAEQAAQYSAADNRAAIAWGFWRIR